MVLKLRVIQRKNVGFIIFLVNGLVDGDVEVAAAGFFVARESVEAVTPVETEEPEHRQVDTDAETGGLVQVEGGVRALVDPCLARLRSSASTSAATVFPAGPSTAAKSSVCAVTTTVR